MWTKTVPSLATEAFARWNEEERLYLGLVIGKKLSVYVDTSYGESAVEGQLQARRIDTAGCPIAIRVDGTWIPWHRVVSYS